MKRLQFLIAAQTVTAACKPNKTLCQHYFIKCANKRDTEIQQSIEALDVPQLRELRQRTTMMLSRERRRCSARSKSYDLNNHIRLYLMHKHLAQNK
jgi:hypothetical protein